MAPLDAPEIAELFSEPSDPEDIYSEAIAAWDGCAQKDPLDRTLQFFQSLDVVFDRAGCHRIPFALIGSSLYRCKPIDNYETAR